MEGLTSQSSNGRSTKAGKRRKEAAESILGTPFEILCDAPDEINPAILLADEMLRKNMAEIIDFEDLRQIEDVLDRARREIESVQIHFSALVKTPASASPQIPPGF